MREDHVLDFTSRGARISSWGNAPEAAVHLADRIEREFTKATGLGSAHEPARPRDVLPSVPPSRATGELVDALSRCAMTRTDDEVRLALSLGKSYPDLLAARSARIERVTDVVVRPRTQAELERVMAMLAERDVAIVPVGGGTSVVGGIEPLGQHDDQVVVSIDLGGLTRTVDVDPISGVATFEAGIRGPRLEESLRPHGHTLGHIPQSFELATLGGWIATRSAGQASLQYGKIESMVAAMRVVTPAGVINVDHLPAHGAGPDLREAIMGSEGTFGIISQATMRITNRPTHIRFASYLHPDFASATHAARTLIQAGIRPSMVRVSDSIETAFSLGGAVPSWLRTGLTRRLVRGIGMGTGSMTIVLYVGTQQDVRDTERRVERHMKQSGAWSLGPVPARSWHRARFIQPYARDMLMDRGFMVDTLETAVPWRVLPLVHEQVRHALTTTLGEGRSFVGCHLSHLYRDGASAYFTFLTRMADGEQMRAWRSAKRSVHDVLATFHAAVSHQHGVGTMHADLYRHVIPHQMLDAFSAMRASVDPTGNMNPGKLIAPLERSRGSINSCIDA